MPARNDSDRLSVLDGDRNLRAELLDELRIVRGQTTAVACRDLDDADETVPRDHRRAEHAVFAEVLGGSPVPVVVVEQRRQLGDRLVGPFVPGLTVSIEAMHAAGLEDAADGGRHRNA
jgi:hypothetical protein